VTITHNTAIVHCVSVKRTSADVVTITHNTAIVHCVSVKRTSADVRDNHTQYCNSTLRVCRTYFSRRRDNHTQYCNSTLRVCQTYFSRRTMRDLSLVMSHFISSDSSDFYTFHTHHHSLPACQSACVSVHCWESSLPIIIIIITHTAAATSCTQHILNTSKYHRHNTSITDSL